MIKDLTVRVFPVCRKTTERLARWRARRKLTAARLATVVAVVDRKEWCVSVQWAVAAAVAGKSADCCCSRVDLRQTTPGPRVEDSHQPGVGHTTTSLQRIVGLYIITITIAIIIYLSSCKGWDHYLRQWNEVNWRRL